MNTSHMHMHMCMCDVIRVRVVKYRGSRGVYNNDTTHNKSNSPPGARPAARRMSQAAKPLGGHGRRGERERGGKGDVRKLLSLGL